MLIIFNIYLDRFLSYIFKEQYCWPYIMTPSKEFEIELQQDLILPEEIQVISFLGRGRRSFSYKGKFDDQDVVIKVYRNEFVEKYIIKDNIDIAEFEFQRNSQLYSIDAIRPYIAQPFKYFPIDSKYTHSFIQQYVGGITLKLLIFQLGYLPNEVLNIGYKIVRLAESEGIHDLDISAGNILVVENNGSWMPKLYDFNLLPQHMSAPNPFMAFCFKVGLRRKSHRDYRSLKNWKRRGRQQMWLGKN